jgi:hypothetical protein
MDLMCPLQNSSVEILIPNVMVLGDGAFGKKLDYVDKAIINGVNVLLKFAKRPLMPHPPCENTARRSIKQEARSYQTLNPLLL